MQSEEDYRIVKRAIKGNKKAFEQLIKQHYEQIYRTAFLYVNNEADALDVVQEAAYQAYISIHSLKSPEYFMTWLTKIVIRCSGQILKKRTNVVPLTEEMLAAMKPEHQSRQEESIELLTSIAHLREQYRTAIILFYYYDYSIKTISDMMETPEGTVKTYLSRGKAALKKNFKWEEESHG